jgi:D-alanyl-D-alanine carboxypeptidase (penicillin-binding protein 5/6)
MKNSRISSQQSKVSIHINGMSFPQVKRACPSGRQVGNPSLPERFPVRVGNDKLYQDYVGKKASYVFFPLFLILCFSFVTSVSATEIKSRAAVVIDAQTGRILYAKNPDARLLPASTTKLVNALVVLERANLDDVTTVSARAAGQPPTKAGLKKGDKVTIRALLYAALMKSANDAAVALAEAVAGSEEAFVKLMNDKAMAIGAEDTRFVNANGLPASGQHITARDLAIIMREAIKYPLLREIMGTRVTEVSTKSGKTMFIKNTNRLLWSDDEVLGGKTGYTRQARHCFVCAGERDNDTIIVALLGAPNRSLLWKEAEYLMDAGEKIMSQASEPVVYLTKLHESPVRTVSARKRHGRRGALRKRSRKNRAALVKNRSRAEKIRAIARQEDDGNRG